MATLTLCFSHIEDTKNVSLFPEKRCRLHMIGQHMASDISILSATPRELEGSLRAAADWLDIR